MCTSPRVLQRGSFKIILLILDSKCQVLQGSVKANCVIIGLILDASPYKTPTKQNFIDAVTAWKKQFIAGSKEMLLLISEHQVLFADPKVFTDCKVFADWTVLADCKVFTDWKVFADWTVFADCEVFTDCGQQFKLWHILSYRAVIFLHHQGHASYNWMDIWSSWWLQQCTEKAVC